MNGKDDKGASRPAKSPFFDDADAPPPARVRPRRAKPPPGIITAGGVDMARAHASGIRVQHGATPPRPIDEPKVVVAVDIDDRKVPTRRKLFEGRDAGDERAPLLPEAAARAPGKSAATTTTPTGKAPKELPAAAPAAEPNRALPIWMRVAFVLVVLLLGFGVARRARVHLSRQIEPQQTAAISPPIEPRHDGAASGPKPQAPAEPPPLEPRISVATVIAAPTEPAPPVKTTHAIVPAARAVAVKAPPPPPASKSTFNPPFQLPGEKK